MAKRGNKQQAVAAEQNVATEQETNQETKLETKQETKQNATEQAVSLSEDFATTENAKKPDESTACLNESEGEKMADFPNPEQSIPEEKVQTEKGQTEKAQAAKPQTESKKSGGTAIGLLALLIALGVGGAGYFFGQQKFSELDSRLTQAQQQLQALAGNAGSTQTTAEMPTFAAEKAQLAKLSEEYQQAQQLIAQLSRQQQQDAQQLSQLQTQLEKLGTTPKAEPTAWLLSDADFLLTNALRKVALDYDIDTAKSLLIEADNVLSQVKDPQIISVREALKADFDTLSNLNKVDQNNVMQRLAQLANMVDDMPMLDNEQLAAAENGDVSDSLADWQQNIEKSANSFLSHFIRISEKGKVQEKAFIAPNQEIYLRENIRLRLQIAILTVPRQQNELYKQSLEAVSTWVRSYFDVKNDAVKQFLKESDDLIEQSIYIDAPNKLQSLDLLKQKLNRREQKVEKIELEVDKAVEQLKIDAPQPAQQSAPQPAEQPAAQPTETQQ